MELKGHVVEDDYLDCILKFKYFYITKHFNLNDVLNLF